MQGGAQVKEEYGLLDYFTITTLAAVISGGFLIGISRNGVFQGKAADDTPPNSRAI